MRAGRFVMDRGTLRAAGFVGFMTVVFLVTNTSVAMAADGSAGGGLLGPLDVLTREGAPLSGYQLEASARPKTVTGTAPIVEAAMTGEVPDLGIVRETQRLVMGGLFTLVRLLVGLVCWLLSFVFRFPLHSLLVQPAQRLADAYERHVVAVLGLEGLILAWAFAFGLILFVRGRVGKGLGEIVLTLVIAALAASAFVRPDYLLGKDGPLDQTHQAALEVASITTSSYFGTAARGGRPCDTAVGPAHEACVKERAESRSVVTPIQHALTDALVVKPYMLLQYGRILDPKKPGHEAAYKAHTKWVKSSLPEGKGSGGRASPPPVDTKKCDGLAGPVKESCEKSLTSSAPGERPNPDRERSANEDCELLIGSADDYCQKQKEEAENPCRLLKGESRRYCESGNGPEPLDPLSQLLKDLEKAGTVGRACAAYAEEPSWDRVWAVVALLVAVVIVALMIMSMAVVMLGAQGADAATAAVGPIVWVLAMLPGRSRMLLWRWWGVFVVSALVSFVAAMCLPLFGIAVDALLSDSGPDHMMERLLLVDALALAFLVMHRRIMTATASLGQRMTMRMQYARIGGSTLGGNHSGLGAALALNSAGFGTGLSGGQSVVHGAFGSRLRQLGSLAALGDGAGMAMSPGRLLGDAVAEGRRGIAPLAMALRGVHTALIGPKPRQHPAAAWLHAAANGTAPGKRGEMVTDEWTGEILHDPDTDRPLLGSRMHQGASRLRGYRIASRTARFAYGATLGLPGTIRRSKEAASEFTEDAHTQLRVAAHRVGKDAAEWMPVFERLHDTGVAVGAGVSRSGRAVGTGISRTGSAVGTGITRTRRAVGTGAVGAVIYTSSPTGASGPRPGGRGTISRQDTPGPNGPTPSVSAIRPPRRGPGPAPSPSPSSSSGSGSGSGSDSDSGAGARVPSKVSVSPARRRSQPTHTPPPAPPAPPAPPVRQAPPERRRDLPEEWPRPQPRRVAQRPQEPAAPPPQPPRRPTPEQRAAELERYRTNVEKFAAEARKRRREGGERPRGEGGEG
ncbi:hypothetical protein ACIPY6_34350 [Streptomyces sp. NPDC090054]|uniref:hypothetical protein n=1 Tax=Streptomyces sp. NPDC090054 TaxID=3365933 RepID=UPI00382FF18E